MTATPAGQPRDDSVSAALIHIVTNHQALAAYLTAWADDLHEEHESREPRDETDFILGYQRALRDMAGHLHAGDGLPGGPVLQGAGAA
ncbi:MAG: hypothetical protein Q4G51_03240 [Dermatophilus congolensis]|nr:hypothetical protein [Dermatophilus congolensis]